MIVRSETAADRDAIRRVHRLAFGRYDEANLVDALRGRYARASLVAEVEGAVVGHVLFSDLPIRTDGGTVPALSLAPLAVVPEFQRRGVGAALTREGLETCRGQGHCIAVVLGHPSYYPRFGFSAEMAKPIASPFGGREAWMALELVPGALDGVRGWACYPPPFGPHPRPAYRPDAAEWARMRAALWTDEGGHAEEVESFFAGRPWDEEVFVEERPDGTLCGFGEASLRSHADDCSTRPVGYIEGWFVDADVRRQGVGRRLVAAAERWAAGRGCTEMASDAHLENDVSRRAHRALGFDEGDRHIHFRKALPASEGAPLNLLSVAGAFAVCRLPPGPVPPWATEGELFSVTRTADELSIVCRQEAVPEGVVCELGWRGLRVAGAMPFTLVGVLASLTAAVASAGVGVFAVSTYDTDYLFVKAEDLARAVAALMTAGHRVEA